MEIEPKAKPRYRADIDGLRALAVTAVVAYHCFGGLFSGGFIGVDIFFVISGYLLGAIVISEAQSGSFSFARFYKRRMLRIFPALFAMMAACTALFWLFLLPSDLVEYGRSMAASSLSVSNLYFWATSDYFDAPAAVKPLLHTWSLAVEEQFYLIFPIFIVLAQRFMKRYLRVAVLLVTACSFAWSVIDLRIDPGAAFYLPFTRAWELLAGTILAMQIIPVPRSRAVSEALSLSALATIVLLVFNWTPNTPFPGERSLLPCAAAGAIILCGQNVTTTVGRMLSSRPAVFVGLISYSLYLWHWPLLVFIHIAILPATAALSPYASRVLPAALAFVVAAFSWRWIETPFRTGLQKRGAAIIFPLTATCVLTFSIGGLSLASARGFPDRFPLAVRSVTEYLDYGKSRPTEAAALFPSGSCFMGRREPVTDFDEPRCLASVPGKGQVLIFGDSHASNLQHGLETAFPEVHFNQATSSSCPPTLEQDSGSTTECKLFVARVLNEYIPRHSIHRVLLNADWQLGDMERLTRTVDLLRKQRVAVLIVGPLPKYNIALPRLLAISIANREDGFAQSQRDPSPQLVDDTMSRMSKETWHVPYVSPISFLCRQNDCKEYAAPGVPMEFDMSHLTLQGSQYVGREIERESPHIFESMPWTDAAATAASQAPR